MHRVRFYGKVTNEVWTHRSSIFNSLPQLLMRFSLRQLLALSCLFAIVLALVVSWNTIAAKKRMRRNVLDEMRNVVGFYMNRSRANYGLKGETIGECLPAEFHNERGRALSSWRFVNIAYLSADWGNLSGSEPHFYSPWDSLENAGFRSYPIPFYCYSKHAKTTGNTNCVAVTGEGTAFEVGIPRKPSQLDGDTVLFVVVVEMNINWMEPGDIGVEWLKEQLSANPPGKKLGITEYGFHVAFADEQVWCLNRNIPFSTLRPFLNVEEAKTHDREKELTPYRVR